MNDGEVEVVRVMRQRRSAPRQTLLQEGDTLILKGDPEALERAIATSELALQGRTARWSLRMRPRISA